MRLKNCTGWMATVALSVASIMVVPCLAQRNNLQRNNFRPVQGGRSPKSSAGAGAHAGDWLRHYQGLPPGERERALQNDPGFRRLSPEQQQLLRQRLQHFSSLPPQEQQRMLNRMETWEHLTPGQKEEARQLFGRMQQLPPNRRRMVTTAIRDLRAMPPDQREKIIDSTASRYVLTRGARHYARSHPATARASGEWQTGRITGESSEAVSSFPVSSPHRSVEIVRRRFRLS